MQRPNVDDWLREVLEANGDGNAKRETIPRDERIEELFLMGLRMCKEGVAESRLQLHASQPDLTFEQLINRNVLKQLTTGGFIEIVGGGAGDLAGERYLRATRKGTRVLDELLPTLLY